MNLYFDQDVDDALAKHELYEPGEIPPYWQETLKRHGIKIMQLAMTFGLVIPEYTMKDYVLHAVKRPEGYETICIHGRQGSKKSCRTLSASYWVYQDWDTVLEELVLVPDAKDMPQYKERGFIQKMQSISKSDVMPLLAYDDYTVGMPSSAFKTDIEMYGAIDSMWAAIRTKVKVVVLNCPLIDRLGKNVKDNVTIEVMIGPNQVEQIERWIHLVGLKQAESNFFKVQIEPLHKFDWRQVPKDVFDQYFELRKEISDVAVHKMGRAAKDEAVLKEDMMSALDVTTELHIAPASFTLMVSKGLVAGEKINGRLYVSKSDVEKLRLNLANKTKYVRKEGLGGGIE